MCDNGQENVSSANGRRSLVTQDHVHNYLVGLSSRGQRSILTGVDKYIRWPEAIPVLDISAAAMAEAFASASLARFGCPAIITTSSCLFPLRYGEVTSYTTI